MDIEELFSDGGALSRSLPSYRPRRGQIEMARAVNDALRGGCTVLEAGTGIGKTFAYLVPVIQSGQRALISTGARALQDQLSQRDIPLLATALQRPVNIAVLKGRSNYLCRQAIEENQNGGDLIGDDTSQWRRLLQFYARSKDGDIRGATDIPANSPVWKAATSTRESCKVQACAHFENCFLYKARARAARADIVIVNHHLFLSDLRLKDEGVAEILPTRDLLLFDEAHLLPQLAPEYFGERLPTSQLARLCADAERAAAMCKDGDAVLAVARRLRRAVGGIHEVCEQWREMRITADTALNNEEWRRAAETTLSALSALLETLMIKADEHERVENLAARVIPAYKKLADWLGKNENDTVVIGENKENGDGEIGDGNKSKEEVPEPMVRWLAREKEHITFHAAPITGRTLFAKQWENTKTAVFTSATLSIDGDFQDFCEAIGAEQATTRHWRSPYDFPNRALLYLPPRLPPPNDQAHTSAVVAAALPLLRANAGRAFVLFSSLRALSQATDELRAALSDEDFEILKQGEMPNDELLNRFRTARRGVLAGSQAFWQGVDVKGEALSLVIVDKIPFTPPDDPMLLARDAWRRRRNENPFRRNQLPPTITLMKQVAGRLMRDDDDYGVFMAGDPRLKTRNYGRLILRALPPMRRCDDEQVAVNFLRTPPPPAE